MNITRIGREGERVVRLFLAGLRAEILQGLVKIIALGFQQDTVGFTTKCLRVFIVPSNNIFAACASSIVRHN